ncbi:hypothetical protein [Ferrimonas marina]|uniref:Uncharacterized protein n=1 Tax=Ferrimonas marina TaxID=299255 RepID=A0A1M5TUP7_9GAMM|nr:hypothetical protein [Ferrimonas marina]SHH54502.1 hypothetical protein SAMN02745129_2286 [Ferrimonas marina]
MDLNNNTLNQSLGTKIRELYGRTLKAEQSYASYAAAQQLLTIETELDSLKLKAQKLAHAAPSVSEAIHKGIESIETAAEQHRASCSQNSLSAAEYREIRDKSVRDYLESVEKFTSAGGKGFYDVSLTMEADQQDARDVFTASIEALQRDGQDIQLVHQDNHNITVVMPSALLEPLEYEIEERAPTMIGRNESDCADNPKFTAHFVQPYLAIEGRPEPIASIKHWRALLSDRGFRPDYVPRLMGYTHTQLAHNAFGHKVQSQYGEVITDPLYDAAETAFSCLAPTPQKELALEAFSRSAHAYSEDEKALLDQFTEHTSLNIKDDLVLYALSNKREIELL